MKHVELGKVIKDKRILKNLTQEDLAFLVGTEQNKISKIERGDFQGINATIFIAVLNELGFNFN